MYIFHWEINFNKEFYIDVQKLLANKYLPFVCELLRFGMAESVLFLCSNQLLQNLKHMI